MLDGIVHDGITTINRSQELKFVQSEQWRGGGRGINVTARVLKHRF